MKLLNSIVTQENDIYLISKDDETYIEVSYNKDKDEYFY